MRLPATNAITLPATNEGLLVADATDPPVAFWNDDELRRLLPAWARRGNLRVRDAVLRALGRMVALVWAGSSRVLNAQRSPRHAAGAFLVEHGAKRRTPRAAGETEGDYRKRLVTQTPRITPDAVKGAIEAVCRDAGVKVYFQEPFAEGWFWGSDSSSWLPFFSGEAARWWGTDPDAEDDVRAAGYWIGPARALFWVFLCTESSVDDTSMFATSDTSEETDADFFGGATLEPAGFFGASSTLDDQVASIITAARGAGVEWTIFFDPLAAST